jgi:hypothetical protein
MLLLFAACYLRAAGLSAGTCGGACFFRTSTRKRSRQLDLFEAVPNV